ncbi:MAG: hypothetical protein LBC67_06085 [Spirochaetales bacterium]|jgi:antitoxin component YwqK of YwqJK toxin-antitoxin module|nr:hypothetical protein [Spirochaetales bacterium]
MKPRTIFFAKWAPFCCAKTGLSAPTPQNRFAVSAGFPLLSLAPHGPGRQAARPRARSARGLLFLLLFTLTTSGLFPENWYQSNSSGLLVKPINPEEKSDYEYSLAIETLGNREKRTLFSREDGEVRRWERLYSEEGTLLEESLYREGEKDSQTLYYPNGLVQEEALFSGGKEDGRFRFEYKLREPRQITFTRGEAAQRGGQDYREEYLYLPSGEFRGVKRRYADGALYTAIYTFVGGIIREEWHSFEKLEFMFRYDKRGNVLMQEEYRDNVLVEKVDFRYHENSPDALREKHSLAGERQTRLAYSPEGEIQREDIFENSLQVEQTLFTYTDGKITRKERHLREGTEEWTYTYDIDKKLKQEEYLVNQEKKLIKLYDPSPEYSRIEEHYRTGKVFLRLYFKDGELVKREFPEEEAQ